MWALLSVVSACKDFSGERLPCAYKVKAVQPVAQQLDKASYSTEMTEHSGCRCHVHLCLKDSWVLSGMLASVHLERYYTRRLL